MEQPSVIGVKIEVIRKEEKAYGWYCRKKKIFSGMILEEKVGICFGFDFLNTKAIEWLGGGHTVEPVQLSPDLVFSLVLDNQFLVPVPEKTSLHIIAIIST
jgi:hypothetical protein